MDETMMTGLPTDWQLDQKREEIESQPAIGADMTHIGPTDMPALAKRIMMHDQAHSVTGDETPVPEIDDTPIGGQMTDDNVKLIRMMYGRPFDIAGDPSVEIAQNAIAATMHSIRQKLPLCASVDKLWPACEADVILAVKRSLAYYINDAINDIDSVPHMESDDARACLAAFFGVEDFGDGDSNATDG